MTRKAILSAIVGALAAVLVNLASVAYWGGEVGQRLSGIEERVGRIERLIDKTVSLGGTP
jgi:hypothetical protein